MECGEAAAMLKRLGGGVYIGAGRGAELSSPWTRGRRRGRVCARMSSEAGDEREHEGELTVKRWPRERMEEEDGEVLAKTATVRPWALGGLRW